MVATVQWRRWITKHHTRQSVRSEPQDGNFTPILMLWLSGVALCLFAIGHGWLGGVENLSSLYLLLQ
jgi:hypothetical protein